MNLNCGRKERSRRGPPHIVRGVLSAGKTLIVDVEGADCRVEGIGAVVQLLTSYLGPLTFVTWPRPLLIHALMCPTHTWVS